MVFSFSDTIVFLEMCSLMNSEEARHAIDKSDPYHQRTRYSRLKRDREIWSISIKECFETFFSLDSLEFYLLFLLCKPFFNIKKNILVIRVILGMAGLENNAIMCFWQAKTMKMSKNNMSLRSSHSLLLHNLHTIQPNLFVIVATLLGIVTHMNHGNMQIQLFHGLQMSL